jgi:3-hydroxyisobutyrate dehydrogenase
MREGTVAVVGVGAMGEAIGRRLVAQGIPLAAVYDRIPAHAARLAAASSAFLATTPAAAAARAEIVLTVVGDDAAMAEVYGADEESLLAQAQGRLFVDMATVRPDTLVAVAEAVTAAGGASIEAMMLGTVPQAESGTLRLLVAGPEDAVARARPLLSLLASDYRHVGARGRAAALKVVVNLLMLTHVVAAAEGLALGERQGFPADLLLWAIGGSAADSRVLALNADAMLSGTYPFRLSARHAAKDVAIALALAEQAGLCLPLAAASLARYRELLQQGHGDLDHAAVADLVFPGRLRT